MQEDARVSALDPFDTVEMLGRWPVVLPAYRVEQAHVSANWEEGRLLSMHSHLKAGDVLYDVGAEHGDISSAYASWLGPEGGVVLVEGSDRFWPVIKATFEANGFTPEACWAGFASDVDTPEELRTPSWADPMFTRGGEWPSWADGEPEPFHGFKSLVESKQTIPNIRFDTLATMCRPPDALTIDVEGAEARVLRGSERILREHKPIVWVSLHPEMVSFDYPEWDGMTAEDVTPWFVDFMASFGYVSHFIEKNHEHHWICHAEDRPLDHRAGVEHLVE